MHMKLNCDLGEVDRVLATGAEHAVMPYIDMANIACGFHAGNRQSMIETITLAKQHRVSIGAHPSYPDRENFGRLSMALNKADVCDAVYQQITLLEALCEQQECEMDYVKPHGALYHDLLHNIDTREGILKAVALLNPKLKVMVLANVNTAAVKQSAEKFGLDLLFEAFADRRYLANGQLQDRAEQSAVITEQSEIIAQAKAISQGKKLATVDGDTLMLKADSLCVHGDNPNAVATIKAIRAALTL